MNSSVILDFILGIALCAVLLWAVVPSDPFDIDFDETK